MILIVPMAGRGLRFAEHGMQTPKPLIPVAGRPMFAWALQSLNAIPRSRLIFIALKEHEQFFGLKNLLNENVIEPYNLVLLDAVTEGQLCTVFAARPWLETDESVLVASADTYVQSSLANDIRSQPADCHGLISVAEMPGERWSFARTNNEGWVVEVAEKVRISGHASTGLYYFSSGRELLEIGDEMISQQEKTHDEYYIIPVYQKYIQRGWKVGISKSKEMWDMGTPEALNAFERYLQKNKDLRSR